MTGDKTLGQKFEQVSQELSTLMNLLNRIDERVEIFMAKQDRLSEKFDDHVVNCPIKCEFPEYMARLSVLEKTTMTKNGNWSRQEHQEFSNRLESQLDTIRSSIASTDKDIRKMENTSEKHEGIWNNVGKFAFQIIVYVVGVSLAAALIHFMQIKPP
jgi:hypothetical protein